MMCRGSVMAVASTFEIVTVINKKKTLKQFIVI